MEAEGGSAAGDEQQNQEAADKEYKKDSMPQTRSLVEWIIFVSIVCITITVISIAICCTCKYLSRLEQAEKRRAEAYDEEFTVRGDGDRDDSERHMNSSGLELRRLNEQQVEFLRVAGVQLEEETFQASSSSD